MVLQHFRKSGRHAPAKGGTDAFLRLQEVADTSDVTAVEDEDPVVELDTLLGRADFVSVHVPLSDRTRHLIGERELRRMKPRAVRINTSYGPVIHEGALVRALTEGWIAATGLDVLETEPPPADHPLLRLDNVVLTPHIASYSDVFRERFWGESVRTLIETAKTGRPLWVVNADAARRPTAD
jgi:phosphoglycerate dehydrogenase-like enzyme